MEGAPLHNRESSLSTEEVARARKIASTVRNRLKELVGKQSVLAEALGVSEATVSRLCNEELNNTAAMLAYLGLAVVPHDAVCISRADYDLARRLVDFAARNCNPLDQITQDGK